MNTISVKLSKKEINDLYTRYPNKKIAKTPPYALYQFKLSDCTITAYESGKVVFQGDSAPLHSSAYGGGNESKQVKSKPTNKVNYPHIGSDEVGTGDYYGPVCVCATYVEEKDLSLLQELKIQDSKQVNDAYILKIAPILMEQIPHSLLILSNELYNQIHINNNMNQIKAKLHNKAYLNLIKKLGNQPKTIYLDQFTPESLYFRYLNGEKEIVRNIHFETKAENKYIGVACGSIIARYAFLKAMEDMETRYKFIFPKGAGKPVDQSIKDFVTKFSKEELTFVAKTHFVNTKKALE
ncbi:MAG: ribonuclease HIII [Erysipelotrichaceae bacterium]